MLAGTAMLVRNGALLAVLSPAVAVATLPAFLVMIEASFASPGRIATISRMAR